MNDNETQAENSLAVLQQQVTALAAPDVTMNEIGTHLGALWDAAQKSSDRAAMQYLSIAWEKTQALAGVTNAAQAVARAALEAAVTLDERNQSLIEAVFDRDLDHSEVGSALQSLHDEAYAEGEDAGREAVGERLDEAMRDGYEAAYDEIVNGWNGEVLFSDPGTEIMDILSYEHAYGRPDVTIKAIYQFCSEDDAENFIRYLAGKTPKTSHTLAEMVAQMIRKFSEAYQKEIAAIEFARNAARQAGD